jgi:hypothetical protein
VDRRWRYIEVGNCGGTGTKAAPFHKELRRIGFPPNLDESDLQKGPAAKNKCEGGSSFLEGAI